MKKKTVLSIGVLLLMNVLLTGCCLKHDWQEATCTEPKTCAKCGKTEGEALGHTWVDATCAEPKTCSVCGETEGEAFGHTWIDATCSEPKTCSVCGETEGNALEHTLSEANYQQAAVCEVCGASVGEPLQADFEKYNLTEHMVELDKEYDYKALCYENYAYTIGKVIFSNYRTFDSDETHEAKEGYEWKMVDVTIAFGDENAQEYGAPGAWVFSANYYDIIKHDDTAIRDDDGVRHFTVNWNGVDYTECCYIFTFDGWSDWTDNTDPAYGDWELIIVSQCRIVVLVPIGYDGIVVGVRDAAADWGEGQHVFEVDNTDSLFFRMK